MRFVFRLMIKALHALWRCYAPEPEILELRFCPDSKELRAMPVRDRPSSMR